MSQTFRPKHICIIAHLIILLWAANSCLAEMPRKEYFIISSGSLGGSYYNAGNVLADLLNDISPTRFVFKAIPTSGSIENIRQIKNRFSDFAIVQRDVFIKNFYGDGDKIKNVSIIAPLFQEKLIIYTHNSSHISFQQFKNTINSSTNLAKIGITSLNGTSYRTFSDIASLLGLHTDKISFVDGNYRELVRKHLSGEIDYVLTFSLPLKELKGAHKVYFSEDEIRLLTSRMRYLSVASFDDKTHKTLGVWALFIGLNSSIARIGEDAIAERIGSPKLAGSPIGRQIFNTVNDFKSDDSLYSRTFNDMPVISLFAKSRIQNRSRIGAYLAAFLSIIILVSFGIWRHRYSHQSGKYLWIRYKHIFISLTVVGVVYLLCLEWLILSEELFFLSNGVKSGILDMTRYDLHIWNFIRIFANNDGAVFPISLTGKLATTLSTYIVWVGGISIAVLELFMYKLTIKRREGLMKVKFEGHVIIAGWNESTAKLIEELLFACKEYHRKSLKIVCVVPDPASILEKHSYISDLEHRKELVFVKGYIRNKGTLEQCNAQAAKIIILLAEGLDVHADELTLMRALSIRKFCCDRVRVKAGPAGGMGFGEEGAPRTELAGTREGINPVYIIAEVNSEEFIADLQDAGVNGIINRSKIVDGLLVQSVLNPGVSKLINNIVTFSEDTNEFYTVDLLNPANSHLRNRTFDELLVSLRKQNILLVAIKVVYRDRSGKEIVDEHQVLELLRAEGLYRQIITNPITETETNRRTDEDDQLITLAVSASRLNEGIKRVSF